MIDPFKKAGLPAFFNSQIDSNMQKIDLRSDTVTLPVPAMRQAMVDAELGDDVYGEDPTVRALETRLADILGFSSAVFVPTGTQSNLCALLSHCQRGEEYIAGSTAHTYLYEAGGAAVLGGIQPQALPFQADGTLDLDLVETAIKPDDSHFAITRLLCLENTMDGLPIKPDYLRAARKLCDRHKLKLHLDGARLFNAAVALKVDPGEISRHSDSVSVCLSKGLGIPAGSVLCGNKAFIASARRWRKMLGGGMRQSGMLAAAGLYALDNHIERLADDHMRAQNLATELTTIPQLEGHIRCQTNMIFLDIEPQIQNNLQAFLSAQDIKVGANRWVTHLGVNDSAVQKVLQQTQAFFSR